MKTEDLFLYDAIQGNKKPFADAVYAASAKLGILPEWLMTAMHFESKLNPKARNPGSSATGLIQFMDATARDLGTTTDQLYNMPGEIQMNYVYKYLSRYAGKMKSLGDVYLAIFYPSALGKGPGYILPLSERTVQLNKALDANKDNKLSAGEITSVIYNYFNKLKTKYPYTGQTLAIISSLLIFAALVKFVQS
ncbi:MAG: hypothetical protein [Bacteriophage sp.]|nr:MAG: hypothetical protein [Bacteriophage sp.]